MFLFHSQFRHAMVQLAKGEEKKIKEGKKRRKIDQLKTLKDALPIAAFGEKKRQVSMCKDRHQKGRGGASAWSGTRSGVGCSCSGSLGDTNRAIGAAVRAMASLCFGPAVLTSLFLSFSGSHSQFAFRNRMRRAALRFGTIDTSLSSLPVLPI